MAKKNDSTAPVTNNSAPAQDADGWDDVDTGLPDLWSGDAQGDVLTGKLVGKSTARGQRGDFVIHTIETPAGIVGVAGAQLTRALENVTRGSLVRITYQGKKDLPGGRTMRTYKVQSKSA